MRSPSWLAAVALTGSLLLPGCPALVSDDYSSDPAGEGEGGTGGDAGAGAAGDPGPAGGPQGPGGGPDPAPPRCDDGALNGGETDVDCGGMCPARCAEGRACKAGPDCESFDCDKGVCQPSRCADGQKNGLEADVDCGAVCPTKCAEGKKCTLNLDCASNNCDKAKKTCRK